MASRPGLSSLEEPLAQRRPGLETEALSQTMGHHLPAESSPGAGKGLALLGRPWRVKRYLSEIHRRRLTPGGFVSQRKTAKRRPWAAAEPGQLQSLAVFWRPEL